MFLCPASRNQDTLPQEVDVPARPTRGRPQKSWGLARPTGFERADDISFRIPIEGATRIGISLESA
jgi:hypothetical protein